MHVENYIFIMTVHAKTKNFFFAKEGHEKTHCKTKKNRVNNYVKVTNVDESAGGSIRKFVLVKVLSKNIKLQLDSGFDLSIINIYT